MTSTRTLIQRGMSTLVDCVLDLHEITVATLDALRPGWALDVVAHPPTWSQAKKWAPDERILVEVNAATLPYPVVGADLDDALRWAIRWYVWQFEASGWIKLAAKSRNLAFACGVHAEPYRLRPEFGDIALPRRLSRILMANEQHRALVRLMESGPSRHAGEESMQANSFQLSIPTDKLAGLEIVSLMPAKDTWALFAVDPHTREPIVVPTGPDGGPLTITSVPVVAWGVVKYHQYFGDQNDFSATVACALILRGGNLVPAELSDHFVGIRVGEYFCSTSIDAGDEAQTGDEDPSCTWYEGRLRSYCDDDVDKAVHERKRRAVNPQETP